MAKRFNGRGVAAGKLFNDQFTAKQCEQGNLTNEVVDRIDRFSLLD